MRAGGDKMRESVLAKNKAVGRRRGRERVLIVVQSGEGGAKPDLAR